MRGLAPPSCVARIEFGPGRRRPPSLDARRRRRLAVNRSASPDARRSAPVAASALALVLLPGLVARVAGEAPTRRVAAVVTEYRHNSHADVIVSRLLLTD